MSDYTKNLKNNFSKFELAQYDLSRRIYNQLHDFGYSRRFRNPFTKLENLETGRPIEGVPAATMFIPRNLQKKFFLNLGYIEGKEGDYGLVSKAVEGRNLPVYQTKEDAISRDKLAVLGNYLNLGGGERYDEVSLEDPVYHPRAEYIDSKGNMYYKDWDLNDYAPHGGNGTSWTLQKDWEEKVLSPIFNLATEVIDFVGNPTVVTTGFQPYIKDNGEPLNLSDFMEDLSKRTNYIKETDYMKPIRNYLNSQPLLKYDKELGLRYELPDVIITPKHKNGNKLTPKKRFLK